MVYENKIPKIEIVYELKENYEIQTSKLSPAAQSKIIRKWGGNYVSERGKESYGPCISCGSSSANFRFGYRAINYLFGAPVTYKHIYENGEDLRDDLCNISTKSGRWATEWWGPFVNRCISDYQASEGYRYAKWALEGHDKGYSVNLKCWVEDGTFNAKSRNQNMKSNWNWEF